MTDKSTFEDLSIVVPAFNEEEGVRAVVSSLSETLPGAEIIVVDDGSTDQTLERACQCHGIVVLQHVFNRGYGASLKTGTSAATRDYVAWFDSDNEHKPQDLAVMYNTIVNDRLAAVIAYRTSGSTTALRRVGKFAIRLLARLLQFNAGADLNCGLRIFRRELINTYLSILPDRFSASLTTTMLMIERGYPVAFHPVTVGERKGQSKVALKDGFAALMKVLDLIMLLAPMRIFFRGGMILILIGLAYSVIRAIVTGAGVPVAGLLLFVTGVLACLLGLIANQLSALRLSHLEPSGVANLVKQSRDRDK